MKTIPVAVQGAFSDTQTVIGHVPSEWTRSQIVDWVEPRLNEGDIAVVELGGPPGQPMWVIRESL